MYDKPICVGTSILDIFSASPSRGVRLRPRKRERESSSKTAPWRRHGHTLAVAPAPPANQPLGRRTPSDWQLLRATLGPEALQRPVTSVQGMCSPPRPEVAVQGCGTSPSHVGSKPPKMGALGTEWVKPRGIVTMSKITIHSNTRCRGKCLSLRRQKHMRCHVHAGMLARPRPHLGVQWHPQYWAACRKPAQPGCP